jgi:hypothetical protein
VIFFFIHAFRLVFCMHFSCFPSVLHILFILFVLSDNPKNMWVKNYEYPQLCVKYIAQERTIFRFLYRVVTLLRAGRPGNWDSISDRDKISSFLHSAETGSGAHPATYQMTTGVLAYGKKKRQERLAYHSPVSTAEVKKSRSYTFTSPYISMVWCLINDRNFTCILLFHFSSQNFMTIHKSTRAFWTPLLCSILSLYSRRCKSPNTVSTNPSASFLLTPLTRRAPAR